MGSTISRRSMLRLGALGLAGVAIGPRGRVLDAFGVPAASAAGPVLSLTMRECLVEMVDQTRVYMWAFDSPEAGLRVPGPVIFCTDGQPVTIDVTNDLPGTHAFAVPGVVDSGPILPGRTVRVSFDAPASGTYVYLDPLRAPLNRAMGLAGVLVVLPGRQGQSPYADPTVEVANLFEDLGTTYQFPGQPWDPDRTWIWVFSTADPASHERVRQDPDLSPEEFLAGYEPGYFMINGKSGYFAAHDPAIAPHGRIGQPALIRTANVGLATHSPHTHGNHVFVLAEAGRCCDNLLALDTWRLPPLHTADVLLPFVRPPDAHPWPPSDPEIFTWDLSGTGMRGLVYPMHCHMELSQMANGGNYPQGAITHWVIEGDLVDGSEPTTTTSTSPTTTTTSTTTTSPSTTTSSSSTTTTTTSTTNTTTTPTTTTTTAPPTTTTTGSAPTTPPTTAPRGGRSRPPRIPRRRRRER